MHSGDAFRPTKEAAGTAAANVPKSASSSYLFRYRDIFETITRIPYELLKPGSNDCSRIRFYQFFLNKFHHKFGGKMSAADKELAAKKLQDPNITEAAKEVIR